MDPDTVLRLAHDQALQYPSVEIVYPFGYGLSYTDFAWAVTGTEAGDVDGTVAVTVEVTNTGTVAGRDVVLLSEGDPLFYGSFMYMHDRLSPHFETEIVPGVPAFAAATATAAATAAAARSARWQPPCRRLA